jgi:uncharacterized membrane protein YkoI
MNRMGRVGAVVMAAVLFTATSLAASPRAEKAGDSWRGYGPGYGMMGRGGHGGMMGGGWGGTGGMMGGGMMGRGYGAWGPVKPLDKPLTPETAAERVSAALKDWGYTDLEIEEVVEYTWNFYALVEEKSTGKGALELLVDPRTGIVSAEPGPNMMWNTKYGHRTWFGASTAPAVSADEAKRIARAWLEASGDRTAWDLEVSEMYGYYSIHLERDGKMEGMLAVNAWTGAVWYHTWHGAFVAAREFAH